MIFMTEKNSEILTKEEKLNRYYTEGGFNNPRRIGYVIKLIRDLQPLTIEEWRNWYLEHIHNAEFLEKIAGEMFRSIPEEEGISFKDCWNHINDVMFRRTFLSYNKDKAALKLIQKEVEPGFVEAPADWSSRYGVDYYLRNPAGKYIGLRLKPISDKEETRRVKEAMERKMNAFCRDYQASVFVLQYEKTPAKDVVFLDSESIGEIRKIAKEKEKTLPEKVKIDFAKLADYTKMGKDHDELASYPFITQKKTGEKDIAWFLYEIVGPDRDNLFAHVTGIFTIAPDGTLTRHETSIDVPFKMPPQSKPDYDEYIVQLKALYKKFSVNKMNSLLWAKAYQPLYKAYQTVKNTLLNGQ